MWSELFLIQAKSDWEVYRFLTKTNFPECHALHYLQMATEKLAKAYLLAGPTDIDSVRATHRALKRFLQLAYRNAGLQKEIRMTAKQLRVHIQSVLPLAHEIENLAPALNKDGPNSEYPWQAPTGTFHTPATHEFHVTNALHGPHGNKLIKLLQIAFEKFYVFHEG